MKYLKLFERHQDYWNYVTSDDLILPNVSHCENEKDVHILSDYSFLPFTIEALEDGYVVFSYNEAVPTSVAKYMEYSKDNGETWTRVYNVDEEQVDMPIQMTTHEKAIVRGKNEALTIYDSDFFQSGYYNSVFYSDIHFNVYGNIMSLIDPENYADISSVEPYAFYGLFSSQNAYEEDEPFMPGPVSDDRGVGGMRGINTRDINQDSCKVVNAGQLSLPATNLSSGCYADMFNNCSSLLVAPQILPAKNCPAGAYNQMFANCRWLYSAPVISADTIGYSGCQSMFQGCASLATPPALPATTLAEGCYSSMFQGCTSLATPPALLCSKIVLH